MLINLNGTEPKRLHKPRSLQKNPYQVIEPYLLTIKCEGKADTIVEHHCTASIGVALFSKHEASQDDISRGLIRQCTKPKMQGVI